MFHGLTITRRKSNIFINTSKTVRLRNVIEYEM